MGIDIYLKWDGQTGEEKEAQITGFDPTSGAVGYLRESYGAQPFATEVLLKEAFLDACFEIDPQGAQLTVEGGDTEEGRPTITLAELKERLPETLETVAKRYGDSSSTPDVQESYRDFVSLAEKKLLEGRKVYVYASY